MVLEKTLESPLDCEEIRPVNPKGNQSWIIIGRTDGEAEAPKLWSPDTKNWLLGKDPDAGKDWRQEEKGTTEVEVVGWHHPTQWTWVWESSGSLWWTEKPGVLQSMGSKRVRHDWATELNWTLSLKHSANWEEKKSSRGMYEKPTNITLPGGRLDGFNSVSGGTQGCPLLPLLLNTGLEVLDEATRARK